MSVAQLEALKSSPYYIAGGFLIGATLSKPTVTGQRYKRCVGIKVSTHGNIMEEEVDDILSFAMKMVQRKMKIAQ